VTPIGKDARFLVLTGPLRGQEGTLTHEVSGGWWRLTCEGGEVNGGADVFEGPGFKRLADAPAEVDPLFVEIEALEVRRGLLWGGPTEDDRKCPSEWTHFASEEIERADEQIGALDGGGDAEYRDAMMRAAMLCLAAVRCIDRAHKPAR